MITLIDYGAGNLASLEGALDSLGFPFQRAERPEEGAESGLILLPGVGHFETARKALFDRGWWSLLPYLVSRQDRPILGICLGLQLLAEGSEEAPKADGLGLLPGIVRRLGPGVKVPHMGWSEVTRRIDHPAFPDLGDLWLYFVHTYALDPSTDTALVARHGRPFVAAEARGRILGYQAHPEKSGPQGRLLLEAALRWLGETPEGRVS